MRYLLLALPLLLGTVTTGNAQISIGIGMPGLSIGINVPVYPQLVRIPGYPVYYDPRASSNYFFYDGLYWVLRDDTWYSSSWYNGPWQAIAPEYVPLFVLRIPVRYYRQPPPYFRGWRADAPPRWGEHWGHEWQQRRAGWDQWNRRSIPAAAPLPSYQREYSGARYPQAVEQQQAIRSGNYRYRPREAVTREQFGQQAPVPAQAPRAQQEQQPRMSQPQPQPRPQAQRPQDEQQRPQPRMAQPQLQQQPQRPQTQAPRQAPVQQREQASAETTHAQPEHQRQTQAARPDAEAQRGRPEPRGEGRQNRAGPQEKESRENKN